MIREMAVDDIEMLVNLGANMHLESDYRYTEYSPDKCRELGCAVINSGHMLGLVSIRQNEITGFFIGGISEHYFSKGLISSDILLYVNPEHRGGLTGARLIKSYVKWAKCSGVPNDSIRLDQTAGIAPKIVDRLYKKLGFYPIGTHYKMRG